MVSFSRESTRELRERVRERLVSVRNGTIETRPIAGTRPRLADDVDAERIRELVTGEGLDFDSALAWAAHPFLPPTGFPPPNRGRKG